MVKVFVTLYLVDFKKFIVKRYLIIKKYFFIFRFLWVIKLFYIQYTMWCSKWNFYFLMKYLLSFSDEENKKPTSTFCKISLPILLNHFEKPLFLLHTISLKISLFFRKFLSNFLVISFYMIKYPNFFRLYLFWWSILFSLFFYLFCCKIILMFI